MLQCDGPRYSHYVPLWIRRGRSRNMEAVAIYIAWAKKEIKNNNAIEKCNKPYFGLKKTVNRQMDRD